MFNMTLLCDHSKNI